jgi:hypothetical protein
MVPHLDCFLYSDKFLSSVECALHCGWRSLTHLLIQLLGPDSTNESHYPLPLVSVGNGEGLLLVSFDECLDCLVPTLLNVVKLERVFRAFFLLTEMVQEL